jgi:hypothetical protein
MLDHFFGSASGLLFVWCIIPEKEKKRRENQWNGVSHRDGEEVEKML